MAMRLNGQNKNCSSLRIAKKKKIDYGEMRSVLYKIDENTTQ